MTNKTLSHDFITSSQIGNVGLTHTMDFLYNAENTIEIIDVQDDKEYREEDVDLILVLENEGIYENIKIEVKTDTYFRTGNLYAETISNMNTMSPGCFTYTNCDYLMYCYEPQGIAYILNMKKAKIWFDENIEEFQIRHTSTCKPNGDRKFWYKSQGRLVPRELLEKQDFVQIVNLSSKVADISLIINGLKKLNLKMAA